MFYLYKSMVLHGLNVIQTRGSLIQLAPRPRDEQWDRGSHYLGTIILCEGFVHQTAYCSVINYQQRIAMKAHLKQALCYTMACIALVSAMCTFSTWVTTFHLFKNKCYSCMTNG